MEIQKNMNSHFWGMADKHYKTLKFEDICNFNIQKIADDDCYLFLWVPSPFVDTG